MVRRFFGVGLVIALVSAGCSWPLGPWGGPAYELDLSKVGTGQEAISLRNDAEYKNGEPMDYKKRR